MELSKKGKYSIKHNYLSTFTQLQCSYLYLTTMILFMKCTLCTEKETHIFTFSVNLQIYTSNNFL